MKKLLLFLCLMGLGAAMNGQNALTRTLCIDYEINYEEDKAYLVFEAKVDSGWHVFIDGEIGGPVLFSLNPVKLQNLKLVEGFKSYGVDNDGQSFFSDFFGVPVITASDTFRIVQEVEIINPQKPISLELYAEYMTCSSTVCLPPARFELDVYSYPPRPGVKRIKVRKENCQF